MDKGNEVNIKDCFTNSCEFIIKGIGNEIIVDKGITRLNCCTFKIYGNNNKIHISAGCKCNMVVFHIEDNRNVIDIGTNVEFTGSTQMAVIEGTKIEIGRDCLFSQNITFRTGDSHGIFELGSTNRINPSKNIKVGEHCWIGHSVVLLKGTILGNDSIVATGAILTGKSYPSNSILGGIPAKVLKTEVQWCSERV